VPWPPRSPDLSVPDFFLWGHLKNIVYRITPHSLRQLKFRIRKCIRAIPQSVLRDASFAWARRCRRCKRVRGGHVETVL
jgi:hypothetical protein